MELALTPTGFGAPGLPVTFLSNGEGRRTQTAGQRKERRAMRRMPQRSLRSSRIRACEARSLCSMARLRRRSSIPFSTSTGSSALDFACSCRRQPVSVDPFSSVARGCCLCDGHLIVRMAWNRSASPSVPTRFSADCTHSNPRRPTKRFHRRGRRGRRGKQKIKRRKRSTLFWGPLRPLR